MCGWSSYVAAVTVLAYTNNETATCEISGTVQPVIVEAWDECGGTITITWDTTVTCGHLLNYVQTITVTPAPAPTFVSTPNDTTILCADASSYVAAVTVLAYTNNETATCEISGTVQPVIVEAWDECGGTITITWDTTVTCGHLLNYVQTITVTPAPAPTFVSTPNDTTILCADASSYVAAVTVLAYTNNETATCEISGTVQPVIVEAWDECGGTITITWDTTVTCGHLLNYVQTITVTPAPAPTFVSTPNDTTILCADASSYVAAVTVLAYTNNETATCEISGTVQPVIVEAWDECGGTITITWDTTVTCGHLLNYVQTITVTPAPAPTFVSTPNDTTILCADASSYVAAVTVLAYTNNETATCEISGTVQPVIVEAWDECGGTITITWDTTVTCGHLLNYVQTITVTPAPAPTFVSTPNDTTILCADASSYVAAVTVLAYTNNETATCEISGTVQPVIVEAWDECGGTITITWDTTVTCGHLLNYVQTITVTPAPAPTFVSTPNDTTILCADASSYVAAVTVLAYTNNETATCEISGTVQPVIVEAWDECGGTITITWDTTVTCGHLLNYVQTITVTPAPAPTFVSTPNDTTILCADASSYVAAVTVLAYTNNETATCEISGTVQPVIVEAWDECGGTITITWDTTVTCGHLLNYVQTITVTPAPAPTFVSTPNDTTILCADASSYVAAVTVLAYTNNETATCEISGTVQPVIVEAWDECGGTITITWDTTVTCGHLLNYVQTITVTPAPAPTFVSTPNDTTILCADASSYVAAVTVLAYTNNETATCEISGTVQPVIVEAWDECGGTITITWDTTVTCGHLLNYVQTITVTPAPAPTFVSTPNDTTILCADASSYVAAVTVLAYTNNETATCEISGTVQPVIVEAWDECGGTITITWDTTVTCGHLLNYVQTITVTPAPAPTFVSTPNDTTILCADASSYVAAVTVLAYTNNETATCEISGTVQPVIVEAWDECGGTITITWDTTVTCGHLLNYVQRSR